MADVNAAVAVLTLAEYDYAGADGSSNWYISSKLTEYYNNFF